MRLFWKSVLYLFVFSLLSNILLPDGIKGNVRDINERNVKDVRVILQKGNKIVSWTLTDRNGQFRFSDVNISTGAYQLVIMTSLHYKMKIPLKKGKKNYRIILIPKENMKEEITVTALGSEKHTSETPMAEAVISKLELKERMPETVVEALSETPGVDFLGKGGHSVTPSIRGLARRRVLLLLNGSRIISDRRVGASASLVLPGLVRRVEIARTASSVIYGSDAMGGVVNLFTGYQEGTDPPFLKLYFNGHSVDSGLETGVAVSRSLGGFSFQMGYSNQRAEDYASPEGTVFHSGFKISSGVATIKYVNSKSDLTLTYFEGFGKDIGKPDRENDPGNYTFNPLIRDRFLQFRYVEKSLFKKGDLVFSGFFNPSVYNLTKVKDNGNKLSKSFTSSDNFGGKLFFRGDISEKLSGFFGADWYGRRSVSIKNRTEQDNIISQFFPLSRGKRDDIGLFATMEFKPVKNIDFNGGIRLSDSFISAVSSGERKNSSGGSPVFYIGVKSRLSRGLSLFLNLNRSFRVPSLTESYYTGLTGRKYVKGNPDLNPESGTGLDSGMKFTSSKLFLGIYFFRYKIKNLIERFRDESGVYTYDNILNGDIYGGEIEFQIFPRDKFEIFGHIYGYLGKSGYDGSPLNDIPSPKIYLGSKYFLDRLWIELNYIYSFKKSRPGPAEIYNDSFHLMNIKGGVYFSPTLFLHLKITNVFNNFYYANADPDIPAAKGTGFSAGITLNIR